MTAEIIAVGSELLTPFRLDTNSLYLTDELNRIGVVVTRKSVVGDDRAQLTAAIREACRRSPIVLISGGLGPTEDDLTRESTAEALGLSLRRDTRLEEHLRQLFQRRSMIMPARNLKQADVIESAEILENNRGTAAGQWLQRDGNVVALLPGPPGELKPMFREQVLPRLCRVVAPAALQTCVLKIADMPESQVDELAAPIYTAHPEIQTTILASGGEIELHFRALASGQETAYAAADRLAATIADVLGENVFTRTGETLEEVVGAELRRRHQTLAVAESCTGGMLGERITEVAGASDYFRGGVICYSNELKESLVGVRPETLAAHGAVSEPTARELALGIKQRTQSDWGLAITGIAGPGGGTAEKPVGLVYIGLAGPENFTKVIERRFAGDRERIRRLSTMVALNRLRFALRETQ